MNLCTSIFRYLEMDLNFKMSKCKKNFFFCDLNNFPKMVQSVFETCVSKEVEDRKFNRVDDI